LSRYQRNEAGPALIAWSAGDPEDYSPMCANLKKEMSNIQSSMLNYQVQNAQNPPFLSLKIEN
jgi:hypothetical protein